MKDLIEKLKKRGETFLRNGIRNYEEKDFDTSMFNLEQAAQLFLKAKILEFGIQFPKLHDINELIKILKKIGMETREIEKEFKETIEKLNFSYISSRYLPFSFSEVDAKKGIEFVKKLREILWKQ